MRFDENTLCHMIGQRTDTGLRCRIAVPEDAIPDRLGFLENLARNKKVIHLGCADHPESLEAKIKQGWWLHGRLTRSAARCLGIDIDRQRVARVIEKTGLDNVIAADILVDRIPELAGVEWDLLIMGELLEHIDNPVDFLSRCRSVLAGKVKSVALTVPNAFSWENWQSATRHEEFINSEHRYWFTPYTLAKVLTVAGYRISSFCFLAGEPILPPWRHGRYILREYIRQRQLRLYPALRPHLAMEAEM